MITSANFTATRSLPFVHLGNLSLSLFLLSFFHRLPLERKESWTFSNSSKKLLTNRAVSLLLFFFLSDLTVPFCRLPKRVTLARDTFSIEIFVHKRSCENLFRSSSSYFPSSITFRAFNLSRELFVIFSQFRVCI